MAVSMPDQNDIPFDQFIVDFFGVLGRAFFNSGSGGGSGGGVDSFFTNLIDFLMGFWSVLVVFSWLITILLIIGIIYAYIRDGQLSALMAEGISAQEKLYAEAYGGSSTNKRWDDVVAHIASDNPAQWRLAIIEADIMLEELLETVGYAGTTVGE